MNPEFRDSFEVPHPDQQPQAHFMMLSRSRRTLLLGMSISSFVAAAALLVAALIRANYAYGQFGPAVTWHWARPALAAGLVSMMLAVTALTVYLLSRGRIAQASAQGLTIHNGRRQRTYPWTALRDLNLSVVGHGIFAWRWGSSSKAVITRQDGGRLRFRGSLQELDGYIRAIKHYLYPLRLVEYRQTLEAGAAIDFGPLHYSRTGIKHRRRFYTWDTIHSARIERGVFILAIHEGEKLSSIRITASKIPNPDLCTQLITSIEY